MHTWCKFCLHSCRHWKLLQVGSILRNGTERNGTERNDGLNCGTECFLRLKLAAYHCCKSYQWHFQQVIKRYPKKDKTNLRIDCGFLLVVISNEVLIVGIAGSVCSSSDISSRELMHDLFLLVCELFLLRPLQLNLLFLGPDRPYIFQHKIIMLIT